MHDICVYAIYVCIKTLCVALFANMGGDVSGVGKLLALTLQKGSN